MGGRFHPHFCAAFLPDFSLEANYPLMWYNYVGEMEWQNFCRTLCAGDFLLGEKSLVKSTPGGATKQWY